MLKMYLTDTTKFGSSLPRATEPDGAVLTPTEGRPHIFCGLYRRPSAASHSAEDYRFLVFALGTAVSRQPRTRALDTPEISKGSRRDVAPRESRHLAQGVTRPELKKGSGARFCTSL